MDTQITSVHTSVVELATDVFCSDSNHSQKWTARNSPLTALCRIFLRVTWWNSSRTSRFINTAGLIKRTVQSKRNCGGRRWKANENGGEGDTENTDYNHQHRMFFKKLHHTVNRFIENVRIRRYTDLNIVSAWYKCNNKYILLAEKWLDFLLVLS